MLGVDGYPKGWVGVAMYDDGSCDLLVGPTVAAVAAQVPEVGVVAVDIPVGLSLDGPRRCDVAAKRVLGARSSTVFLTPVRAALEAPTYEEANAVARACTGAGISKQAYALRERILEVDAWVRQGAGVEVYEAHPELSFARMAGQVVSAKKTTWPGAEQRRRALAAVGIEPPWEGAVPPDVPVADVLDAAACAWTAGRIAAGVAERVGGDGADARLAVMYV